MIILRIWMVTIILDSSVNFRKLSSKVTKLDGTNLVTSVTSISTTHIWLQEYLLQVHRRISFVHNFGNRYSMITLLRVFLLVLVFSDYTQPRAQSTKTTHNPMGPAWRMRGTRSQRDDVMLLVLSKDYTLQMLVVQYSKFLRFPCSQPLYFTVGDLNLLQY